MLEHLLKIEEPWLTFCSMDKNEFDNLLLKYRQTTSSTLIVKRLRGSKMKTTASLDDEFSAVLQFPSYYGGNWAAFDECISDLEWLPGDGYIIAINDIQDLLIGENIKQLSTLMKILRDNFKEWSQPLDLDEAWGREAKPFHFLFQYEEKYLDKICEIFNQIGINIYDYPIVRNK